MTGCCLDCAADCRLDIFKQTKIIEVLLSDLTQVLEYIIVEILTGFTNTHRSKMKLQEEYILHRIATLNKKKSKCQIDEAIHSNRTG